MFLTPWRSNSTNFLDNLFDNFFGEELGSNSISTQPVERVHKDFHLEYGFPGVTREEIKVETDGREVTIKVDSERTKMTKRFVSDVHDMSKIDAKYKDGLLTIDIPLKEDKKQGTKKLIQIK